MRTVASPPLGAPCPPLPSPFPRARHVSGGVSISVQYAFFTARARLTLPLLLATADPSAPISYQAVVDEPAAAAAAAAAPGGLSACTALVTAEPMRPRVAAIVDAHATGFGRLRAIHAALMYAFVPA